MSKDKKHWHFLVNPAAKRGKGLRRWQQVLPALRAALPGMTVAESTAATGMTALAEAAVRQGNHRLVGVGGDGTHHDILNGIAAAGGLGSVVYAPFPLGTGNDWVRTLGTPRRLADWLIMLQAERTLQHGVGRLQYWAGTTTSGPADTGQPVNRYFLNVAGMAYDAEVVRRSETARYKHRFLYPLLTLWYLKDFSAPTVRIDYDGQSWSGPVHTINFGIGRYSGGGMRLVPQADPACGRLALTFARRLPGWRIVLESWRFYTGTVGRVTGVVTTLADTITVSPLAGRAELEADGEWLGTAPVEVRLADEMLTVIIR